jgi:hypothetical protein
MLMHGSRKFREKLMLLSMHGLAFSVVRINCHIAIEKSCATLWNLAS